MKRLCVAMTIVLFTSSVAHADSFFSSIASFFSGLSQSTMGQSCCYTDPSTGTRYIVPAPVYGPVGGNAYSTGGAPPPSGSAPSASSAPGTDSSSGHH